MSLAWRHSPCTSKEARQNRGKDNGGELSAIKLEPPSCGVASRQAQRLVTVRLQRHRKQECSSSIKVAAQAAAVPLKGLADPLHGLVAASRLRLDHVVAGSRLRQLKELCVALRSLSTRAIVSKCNAIGEGSPFRRRTRQANASSHNCRAALLKALAEGCGRPHIPTTVEVNHGELLTPETSGGHEHPDRHDVEVASHRAFQVRAFKQEDVFDRHHWIHQLGHQVIGLVVSPRNIPQHLRSEFERSEWS